MPGVIAGYRVLLDPGALGLPVTAFARVRPGPGQLPKIAELAAQLPQVSECYRITGEDCFLVKIHAASVEQIESVLDRFLLHGQTTTSIVVSTPVPPRPLPLPGMRAAADARSKAASRPAASALTDHRPAAAGTV